MVSGMGFQTDRLQMNKDEMLHMPTSFQDPLNYHFLDRSFRILMGITESKKFSINDRQIIEKPPPVFGTIVSNKFNAIAAAPNNEPVIVFNEGLLVLVCSINDVLAYLLFNKDAQETDNKKYGTMVKQFISASLSYHYFGNFFGAWSFANSTSHEELADDEMSMSLLLDDVSVLFVAAHEYAHWLLEHFNNSKTECFSLNGVDVEQLVYDWKQEYDADRVASWLTMQYDVAHKECLVFGIVSTLCAMKIVELNPENINKSHPPAAYREERIYRYLVERGVSNELLQNIVSRINNMIKSYNDFIAFLKLKDIYIGLNNAEDIIQVLYSEYIT